MTNPLSAALRVPQTATAGHRTATSRILALLLFALLSVVGCGDSTEPTGNAGVPADMDAYLAGLPNWESFSPLLSDFDGPTGEDPTVDEETVDGTTYSCTSTPYSITQTPDEIVTLNPDVEVLWTGSLLQGTGYVGGIGSLSELPIRQRAPLTITLDLLTENNTRTVDDPTSASVNQAVGSLVQAATDAGHRAGSRISYNQVEYHSLVEASVRMGLSAAYYGATIKASLEANVKATTSTVLASYIQQMFTVSVVLPQSPGSFFSDAFTEDLLQQQVDLGRIGEDNLPVFVSSIVYGRAVVFSMTAEGTSADIKAALSIAAGEVGGELSEEQRALLETSEIKLVAIGGDAENAAAVIRSGDFSSYFDQDAELTTARPISYTVRNLADNVTARVSETTEYNIRECAAPAATGRSYRIQIVDLKWTDGGFPCVPVLQTLVSSEFWIEDSRAVTKAIDESGGGVLSVGESHQYPTGPPNSVEVNLHFDRRDQVRIFGDVWTIYPNHFDWNDGIRFRGSIPAGVHSSFRRASVLSCNQMRIRYRVTVLGDLND